MSTPNFVNHNVRAHHSQQKVSFGLCGVAVRMRLYYNTPMRLTDSVVVASDAVQVVTRVKSLDCAYKISPQVGAMLRDTFMNPFNLRVYVVPTAMVRCAVCGVEPTQPLCAVDPDETITVYCAACV